MQKLPRAMLFAVAMVSLCAGCSNSLDSMLGSYNGGYHYETKAPEAYTIDTVDGEDMLRNIYVVYYRSTLNLVAPAGAAFYEWTITTGKNANQDKEGVTAFSASGTSPELSIYIPDKLKSWESYTLTLSVTRDSGLTYSDTAILSVYDY